MKKELAAAVLIERLVRDAYPQKQSSAVQPLQWSILRYLAQAPEDVCELKTVAAYVGLTLAPVSRSVATLEKRGFVTKKNHPDSRRSVNIQITLKGKEALEQDPLIDIATRITMLPEEDLESFLKAIRRIVVNR